MTIAPGWYPDGSGAVRRWDGSAWTQEVRPGPGQRPVLPRWWFALSRALGVALVLTTAANIANLFVAAAYWRIFARWAERPRRADVDTAETYDSVSVWAANTLTVLHFVVFGLLVVWMFTVHRSDRMDPALLEHDSGWAIGGWFVPLLNLVRPYQVMEDVQRAAQRPGSPLTHLPLWWWVTFVIAFVGNQVTQALFPDDDARIRDFWGGLARANLSDSLVSIAYAVSGVVAVLLVRHVTELVRVSPHARA